MNASRNLRLRFLPLAAALLGGALPARAEPAMLTVGQGWALVREFFPSSGEQEIDRIVWTNPPPQLDPDTLQIWNVRRPWSIQDWRWIEPGKTETPDQAPPPVWRPRERPPAAPPDGGADAEGRAGEAEAGDAAEREP